MATAGCVIATPYDHTHQDESEALPDSIRKRFEPNITDSPLHQRRRRKTCFVAPRRSSSLSTGPCRLAGTAGQHDQTPRVPVCGPIGVALQEVLYVVGDA